MNLNETKKDLNSEIWKELEKSKLKVLTNENDFLVKNLKKAGWLIRDKKFLNHKIFKNTFLERNNDCLNDHPYIFNLSNIKFLLNIEVNTRDTKHIKQILVILFKSQ